MQSLANRMSASEIFGACFGAASRQQMKFPTTAFQRAVAEYLEQGDFDNAFRIAVAFPHLPGCVKAMTAHPIEAEANFLKHFPEEPHHASYALARLFEATDRIGDMCKWAKIGRDYPEQPPSRLADLRRMLEQC